MRSDGTIGFYAPGTPAERRSSTAVSQGAWTHVAARWDVANQYGFHAVEQLPLPGIITQLNKGVS
ncbi:MAG: hypothetical protein K9N51_00735 [Candidatus Pacebacteria bacterium]|nr:hypothetical protein [Candidatus Paceibacterota bacterium]